MNGVAGQKEFTDFMGSKSEPEWLKEYRQNNFEAFLAARAIVSHYTDMKELEAMLKKPDAEPEIRIEAKGKVIALEFSDGLKKEAGTVRKTLSEESGTTDRFGAFANAFFTTGYFAFAEKGSGGEFSAEIEVRKGMNCVKSVIAMENGNKVCAKERILSSGNGSAAILISSGAKIENGSCLEFSSSEELNADSTIISSREMHVGRDSGSKALYGWFGGKEAKSGVRNHLCGSGAEALHLEALFGTGKQHFDLSSDLLHEVPDTSARVSMKAALNNESSSIFNGMIKILKEGQKTNSFLECHSILLGKNASSNNVPGLEIEANDVKATHSASVRKIDEEDVFYLESRGIRKEEANRILVSSFFGSIINAFPSRNERERFLESIAGKYEGG